MVLLHERSKNHQSQYVSSFLDHECVLKFLLKMSVVVRKVYMLELIPKEQPGAVTLCLDFYHHSEVARFGTIWFGTPEQNQNLCSLTISGNLHYSCTEVLGRGITRRQEIVPPQLEDQIVIFTCLFVNRSIRYSTLASHFPYSLQNTMFSCLRKKTNKLLGLFRWRKRNNPVSHPMHAGKGSSPMEPWKSQRGYITSWKWKEK